MHLFQVPSKLLISAYDLTTNNWEHPNFLFKALLNELSFHYSLSRHPLHRVPQKPKAITGLTSYSTFWKSLRIWIIYASHNISNIPTYCHSALTASRNSCKTSRAGRCSKFIRSSNTECGEKSKGGFRNIINQAGQRYNYYNRRNTGQGLLYINHNQTAIYLHVT